MPKISALTADNNPTSDDLTYLVNDPAGTPTSKKSTLGNVITKAHGLSDGIVSSSTGVLNTTLSLDTDTNLAANSDTKIPSQKAIKTYTDNILGNANALVYKGTIDCSGNPNYPAANAGDLYVVSVAGKIGGASGVDVEVGDMAICNTDSTASGNQATVGQYWNVIQKNIVGAVTGPASSTDDNIAVYDGATGKLIKDGSAKVADFITKALIDAKGDLIVGSADNTPSILTSSGVNGDVLTVDTSTSSGLKWAAGGGGGGSDYDAVVASTGGTHTTLGSALSAASNGWRILVKSGTYTESAITSSLTEITIEGEDPRATILDFSSNNFTMSGNYLTLKNIKITNTTSSLTFSGTESLFQNVYFYSTGRPSTNATVKFSCPQSNISHCYFHNNVTSGNFERPIVEIEANKINFTACRFDLPARAVFGTSWGTIRIVSAEYIRFTACDFLVTASASGTYFIIVVGSSLYTQFIGCSLTGTNEQNGIYINSPRVTVNGCTFNEFTKSIWLTSSCFRATITSNLINMQDGCTGIEFAANDAVFTENVIYSFGTSSSKGFYSSNPSYVTVSNNRVIQANRGLDFEYIDYCTITGNNLVGCTTPLYNILARSSVVEGNLGTTAPQQNSNVRMKNTSGGAIDAGSVVILKSVAAGDEITTTTTAGDDKVFGVCENSHSNNGYNYIITKGKVNNLRVNGTTDIAIGDFLSTHTVAGIAAKASAGDMVFAVALEAYTNDDSDGVIDALLIPPRLI
jgi:hypothetical protein